MYSGKDGTALWTFDGENAGDGMGNGVSDAGDVNLDGTPDIVVSSTYTVDPNGTPLTGDEIIAAGRVYVYSVRMAQRCGLPMASSRVTTWVGRP